MRVTAVGDEETCTWLQLSGIGHVYPVMNPEEAGPILADLLPKSDEIAIILVTPEVAEANSGIIAKSLQQLYPIILELPTKVREKDPLRDLIRTAVGVDLEI
ncbi:MAG: V-type ATP synthase subunit F [Candidatus Thorarchaeota archaeon]